MFKVNLPKFMEKKPKQKTINGYIKEQEDEEEIQRQAEYLEFKKCEELRCELQEEIELRKIVADTIVTTLIYAHKFGIISSLHINEIKLNQMIERIRLEMIGENQQCNNKM